MREEIRLVSHGSVDFDCARWYREWLASNLSDHERFIVTKESAEFHCNYKDYFEFLRLFPLRKYGSCHS